MTPSSGSHGGACDRARKERLAFILREFSMAGDGVALTASLLGPLGAVEPIAVIVCLVLRIVADGITFETYGKELCLSKVNAKGLSDTSFAMDGCLVVLAFVHYSPILSASLAIGSMVCRYLADVLYHRNS
jgi:hypothetical protein